MANVLGPAAGPAQQPHPNFQLMSNDYAQITEVHQRLSNQLPLQQSPCGLCGEPAVDQGNHMAQELAALRRAIETRFTVADRQFEELNRQLAETDNQLAQINSTLHVKQV